MCLSICGVGAIIRKYKINNVSNSNNTNVKYERIKLYLQNCNFFMFSFTNNISNMEDECGTINWSFNKIITL